MERGSQREGGREIEGERGTEISREGWSQRGKKKETMREREKDKEDTYLET